MTANKIGAIIAGAGAIVGFLALYLFVRVYHPMIQVELDAGRPDEAFVVQYVFPLLGYLAITAGVLWALSFYGFLIGEKYAWMLGLIAGTLSLLAGFFPMIPAMSRGETPITAVIFVANLVLWIGLLYIRKIPWKISLLAFAAGLAYIMAFMDGVATIDKIQLSMDDDMLNGMYIMVQQINWWASAAWAIFIFVLLARKPWAQVVGLGAGLMASIGGYPLAIANMQETGRFSMFAPSPLLSTALIIVLLLSSTRALLAWWASDQQPVAPEPLPAVATD